MPKAKPNPMSLSTPLTEAELDELDQLLLSDTLPDESMVLPELDGFLTAIVIGPETVLPSVWLPKIWGMADDVPVFQDMAQAQRVLTLVMRHMNGIAQAFMHAADGFEPMFDVRQFPDDPREHLDGEIWAHGFKAGVELTRAAWQPMLAETDFIDTFRAIELLGADEIDAADEALVATPEQREALALQISAGLAAIHRYWLARRVPPPRPTQDATAPRRRAPKIGRNDPCPCGSGRKYKHCCGAPRTLH